MTDLLAAYDRTGTPAFVQQLQDKWMQQVGGRGRSAPSRVRVAAGIETHPVTNAAILACQISSIQHAVAHNLPSALARFTTSAELSDAACKQIAGKPRAAGRCSSRGLARAAPQPPTPSPGTVLHVQPPSC